MAIASKTGSDMNCPALQGGAKRELIFKGL